MDVRSRLRCVDCVQLPKKNQSFISHPAIYLSFRGNHEQWRTLGKNASESLAYCCLILIQVGLLRRICQVYVNTVIIGIITKVLLYFNYLLG